MLILLVCSILLGAVLGTSFKVFILIPAIPHWMVAVTVVGIGRGDNLWTLAPAVILAATALQLGYLGGTFGTEGH